MKDLFWRLLTCTRIQRGMSITLFYQMKQEASVCRTYKEEMVVVRSNIGLRTAIGGFQSLDLDMIS